MNFPKTSKGREGVISDPKNYVADFCGNSVTNFQENEEFLEKGGEGVHSNPKNFVADFSTSRKNAT